EHTAKSIERAAATLKPAPNAFSVIKITVTADAGNLHPTANEVVTIASRIGGSASKGLQDRDRLTALVDVPSNRQQEFRAAIESIGGERPGSTTPVTATSPSTTAEPGSTLPATVEKKSFVVHIVEAASKQD